jgi:hypothetical protein
MMTSWKCAQCGLVNFASETNCKRCGAAAETAGVEASPLPTGIVLEDGYVLPPPPSIGGIWRDKATLVMTKDASLPDRCVKCNAPANGLRLKRRLAWHYPVLYLVALFAVLIYVILAAMLSKRATVFLGLCHTHFQRRRKQAAVGWLLLVAGLITAIAAIANDYPRLALLGFSALLFATFFLVFVSRIVAVKKIDDRLVWLNGINSDYLAQLPPWQENV